MRREREGATRARQLPGRARTEWGKSQHPLGARLSSNLHLWGTWAMGYVLYAFLALRMEAPVFVAFWWRACKQSRVLKPRARLAATLGFQSPSSHALVLLSNPECTTPLAPSQLAPAGLFCDVASCRLCCWWEESTPVSRCGRCSPPVESRSRAMSRSSGVAQVTLVACDCASGRVMQSSVPGWVEKWHVGVPCCMKWGGVRLGRGAVAASVACASLSFVGLLVCWGGNLCSCAG